MATAITSKGQVTIPKRLRDAMDLQPGSMVSFEPIGNGEHVLRKVGSKKEGRPDRFDQVLVTADIRWRTDELMALLRRNE